MSDYREPIVLTLFKQVSDGYVFRAPSPWVVGPARHYLVNEAQKTEIMAILMPPRPMLRVAALVIPLTLWLLVFTQVVVRFGFDLAHVTSRDIFVMCGLFVVPLVAILQVFHWWNLRLLRPVLADLPRTTAKIPNRDLYPALVEALPVWNLALLAFGLSMTCLGAAATLASKYGRYGHVGDASSLFSLFLVTLTGAPAAYLFYRAIRKATQKQRPSDAGSRTLPAARFSASYKTSMALAIVLGLGMMGFGAAEIVNEYNRGRSVSRMQSQQESIRVRLDELRKEIAAAKPSDGRSHLESLRNRLDAIKKESDALKRDGAAR